MPKSKNTEFRFQVLDRCFSDFHHEYTIDDLLEKVNEQLYDVSGRDSMIKMRQLRSDINVIRKMLPGGVYDGQQRLTTIFLLYKYLIAVKGWDEETLKEEDGKELYHILYETREDSALFLDNLSQKNQMKKISHT